MLTASLAGKLIALWLVISSQTVGFFCMVSAFKKQVCCAPGKGKKDSLIRQGMQKIPLNKLGKRRRKECLFFIRERTNSGSEKNVHLILHSSTRALVVTSIFKAPKRGFHRESVCTPTKPAHIPHNMHKKVEVQNARWQLRSISVHKKFLASRKEKSLSIAHLSPLLKRNALRGKI